MSEIFNKEALETFDQNEAEEMARVASPKLRLVLVAMVAMLLVVAFWCVFGTINYKVNAKGVIFPFGEATPVSVPYDGVVSRNLVSPGATAVYGTGLVEVRNALSSTVVTAPHEGVVLETLPQGTAFKAGEPMVWFLPQQQQHSGCELLCYVTFDDLSDLRVGQQVQATPSNLQREEWGYIYGTIESIALYPTTQLDVTDRLKLDPLTTFIPEGEAVYEVHVLLDEQDGHLRWSRGKSQQLKVPTGSFCDIQIITKSEPVWRVIVGAVNDEVVSMTGK